MAEPASDAVAPWTLPSWEYYSDAAKSSLTSDWSEIEADVSFDTASSVVSTDHQRVYRIQRAKGSSVKEKQHGLRMMGQEEESALREKAGLVKDHLLAQQSEISAELRAVRSQLRDFQDKWKKMVQTRASETEKEETKSSNAETGASSWVSPIPGSPERIATNKTVSVQTERVEEEEAVKHWLLRLTQKLETLTRKYTHDETLNYEAAMMHITGFQGVKNDGKDMLKQNNDDVDVMSVSSWHLGGKLKSLVSLEIAEHFLELEQAIATLGLAVEQHERRQMTNFDRAVQQVQGYHHERIQRVVDESLAELKLVRKRYKDKESQLQEEIRASTKVMDQLKQSVLEAEHRSKLDRETLEFQLSAVKKQNEHTCRRYEDEITHLKQQLESVRAELTTEQKSKHEVIAQERENGEELERHCQTLQKQLEHMTELHNQEVRVLQETVRQLGEKNEEMELRYATERQSFVETLDNFKLESKEREERRHREREQEINERLAKLKKQHDETIDVMKIQQKQELIQLTEDFQEKNRANVRTIETQTLSEFSDETQAQIQDLRRRCRALEKLLDKKFEDTSFSKPQCDTCSDNAKSTSRASRQSSLDNKERPMSASGRHKALARSLLGSSSVSLSKMQPLINDTTITTDDATLGAHEMWDSASFTSIDTMDDLSSFASQRTTPRPRPRMKSTQEILALVRQIKQTTLTPVEGRKERVEPDPEGKLDFHQQIASFVGQTATRARESHTNVERSSAFDDLLG